MSQPAGNGRVLAISCFMNHYNRDLLVLLNQERMSQQALEHEVHKLHELLFNVERTDNLAIAFEIIDLNRSKVIIKHHVIRDHIRFRRKKSFVFLFNRN